MNDIEIIYNRIENRLNNTIKLISSLIVYYYRWKVKLVKSVLFVKFFNNKSKRTRAIDFNYYMKLQIKYLQKIHSNTGIDLNILGLELADIMRKRINKKYFIKK